MIHIYNGKGNEEGAELQFSLVNEHYTYSVCVFDARFLVHLYWGDPTSCPIDPATILRPRPLPYMPRIRPQTSLANWPEAQGGYSLHSLPQEYPAWGTGDMREAGFKVLHADGTSASRLEYQGFEIIRYACQPEQMELFPPHPETVSKAYPPAGEHRTLCIHLADPKGDLALDLFYITSEHSPVLIRWARFLNVGSQPFVIEDPASVSLDLPAAGKELIRLHGDWGRERHVQRIALSPGQFSGGSINGASSHQSSPFFALADKSGNEQSGTVHAFALVYSGNFKADCIMDEYGNCRMSMGIQKMRSTIAPHESFDTPCAILAHSTRGFSKMSASFHDFIRRDLVPQNWKDVERKIIINSWEAMYFDVSMERIAELARQGKKIGAELLVLDDGWFSTRRDAASSLGDWWYNAELFPEGIAAVADAVRKEGLEFGLWLEPEMVSPNSELFRKHPEWALQIKDRERTEVRNQLVLDLSNTEVVDYLFQSISNVLDEAKPSYIKWDMNRNMTEPASLLLSADTQGELMHRYILGLYSLLSRIRKKYPDLFIESCAGGGGRFDLGLARFSPRFWTSDQTDALERLPIQYGSSLVFPPEMMGAHVSAVPNHQVGRTTSPMTRCLTALPFSFGFELDPAQCSAEDSAVFREASEHYKEYRAIFHRGDFIRLKGPLASSVELGEGSEAYAWMIRSPDIRELFVFYFQPYHPGVCIDRHVRLHGITQWGYDGCYRDTETGKVYPMQVLEQKGLPVPHPSGDYQGVFWRLSAVVEGSMFE